MLQLPRDLCEATCSESWNPQNMGTFLVCFLQAELQVISIIAVIGKIVTGNVYDDTFVCGFIPQNWTMNVSGRNEDDIAGKKFVSAPFDSVRDAAF